MIGKIVIYVYNLFVCDAALDGARRQLFIMFCAFAKPRPNEHIKYRKRSFSYKRVMFLCVYH